MPEKANTLLDWHLETLAQDPGYAAAWGKVKQEFPEASRPWALLRAYHGANAALRQMLQAIPESS